MQIRVKVALSYSQASRLYSGDLIIITDRDIRIMNQDKPPAVVASAVSRCLLTRVSGT